VVLTRTDNSISGSRKFASKQTNIGACIVPADAAAGRPKNRIYVYFVDDDKHLFRSYSDIENGVFPSKKPDIVQVGSSEVFEMSQISVHPDPANKKILIYVVKTNSTKISVLEDKYDTK
jgi:hypothetical protein